MTNVTSSAQAQITSKELVLWIAPSRDRQRDSEPCPSTRPPAPSEHEPVTGSQPREKREVTKIEFRILDNRLVAITGWVLVALWFVSTPVLAWWIASDAVPPAVLEFLNGRTSPLLVAGLSLMSVQTGFRLKRSKEQK